MVAFLNNLGLDVDLCYVSGPGHNFVIIEGDVICDPWADKVYYASEFANYKNDSHQIKYSKDRLKFFPDMPPYLQEPLHLVLVSTDHPAIMNNRFCRLKTSKSEIAQIDEEKGAFQPRLLFANFHGAFLYKQALVISNPSYAEWELLLIQIFIDNKK